LTNIGRFWELNDVLYEAKSKSVFWDAKTTQNFKELEAACGLQLEALRLLKNAETRKKVVNSRGFDMRQVDPLGKPISPQELSRWLKDNLGLTVSHHDLRAMNESRLTNGKLPTGNNELFVPQGSTASGYAARSK
jgi:hypothetical protein